MGRDYNRDKDNLTLAHQNARKDDVCFLNEHSCYLFAEKSIIIIIIIIWC